MKKLTGLLFLLSVILILYVDTPAMIDYVNHLARMHLLVDAANGNPNPFYVVEWKVILNLAVDLIVPEIAKLTGVEMAMKLFLIASQFLVVSGAIALEQTVKGRSQFGGVLAIIMLCAIPFAWGLVNFEFGVGIALWAITVWIALAERTWLQRLTLHTLFVLALFASHVFALGLYGIVIGMMELAGKRRFAEFALMAAPVLLLALIFTYLPHEFGQAIDWQLDLKLLWPVIMMNPLSIHASAATFGLLVALLGFLIYQRSLAVSRQGVWVIAGFVLMYVIFPRKLFESAFADIRILAMLILILPAFVTFSESAKPLRGIAVTTFVTAALTTLGVTASVWLQRQRDYTEVKESFERISPGSRILVTTDRPFEHQSTPLYYAPTLATHYRGAFVVSLYTVVGAQPIRKALAGYEVEDSLDYLPQPLVKVLANEGPSYTRQWRQKYDFIYVFHDMQRTIGLDRVYRGRQFSVYRVSPG